MVNKKVVGVLTLLISLSIIYIYTSQVKLKVATDKTTFYVYLNNSWQIGGNEYNKLYNGTKSISKTGTTVDSIIVNNTVTIRRVATYQTGTDIIDTYKFDGSISDVSKIPISHTIEIFNGKGLIYQYDATSLTYSGPTKTNVHSPQLFGRGMKIEWDEKNYFATLYSSRDLRLKYKILSVYEIYNIRMFDPTVTLLLNSSSVNRIYEYNEPINITGTTDTNSVCLSIDAYGYGNNYTCNTSSSNVNVTLNAFTNQFKFNDSTTFKNLTVNTTVFIQFHNKSIDLVNSKWNFTGFGTNGFKYDTNVGEAPSEYFEYFFGDTSTNVMQSVYLLWNETNGNNNYNKLKVYIYGRNGNPENLNARYNITICPTTGTDSSSATCSGTEVILNSTFNASNTFSTSTGWINILVNAFDTQNKTTYLFKFVNTTGSDKDGNNDFWQLGTTSTNNIYGFNTMIISKPENAFSNYSPLMDFILSISKFSTNIQIDVGNDGNVDKCFNGYLNGSVFVLSTLNDSSSAKNFTFGIDGGYNTAYINLPRQINISSAYLDVTGYMYYGRPYTYGLGASSGNTNPTYAYDGNLNDTTTYARAQGDGYAQPGLIIYYFSLGKNVSGAKIFYTVNGTTSTVIELYNYTKLDYDIVNVAPLTIATTSSSISSDYINSTGNVNLRIRTGSISPGIWINLWDTYIQGEGNSSGLSSVYPNNTYINTGNDLNIEWNYVGVFNKIVTIKDKYLIENFENVSGVTNYSGASTAISTSLYATEGVNSTLLNHTSTAYTLSGWRYPVNTWKDMSNISNWVDSQTQICFDAWIVNASKIIWINIALTEFEDINYIDWVWNDYTSGANTLCKDFSQYNERSGDASLTNKTVITMYVESDNVPAWIYIDNLRFKFKTNISSDLTSYLWSSDCTGINCNVPILLYSSTAGILQISNINIQYNPNPISLNLTRFKEYLNTSINVPIRINASSWGTLQINNLNFPYNGSQNITIIAHTPNYSVNDTQFAYVAFSNYSKTLPYTFTDVMILIPTSNSSKNVTPYGQTNTTPFFNITGKNYDKDFDLGIRLNTTAHSCFNITVSNTTSKSDGFILNTTFRKDLWNMGYLESQGLRYWLDLNNCPIMILRNITIQTKSCCSSCMSCW
jgi:hypothetical protein